MSPETSPSEALKTAICANDAGAVANVLRQHPSLEGELNRPLPDFDFGATPLLGAVYRNNREMVEVLLDAGADIDARSDWWAGSFGVLDHEGPLADFLIERGATIDAHAAARLGRLDDLKRLVSANPGLVHSRGGDGQIPLHFARTIAIAEFLLERGADIDARDVDHARNVLSCPAFVLCDATASGSVRQRSWMATGLYEATGPKPTATRVSVAMAWCCN